MKIKYNNNLVRNEQQPFHLVDKSPWPLATAIGALQLVLTLVMYMHYNILSFYQFSILAFIYPFFRWMSDIIIESTYQGHHTLKVRNGLKLGMILFIVSEIMFFFAFFFAFFNASLNPSIWIGNIWPPEDIQLIDPFGLPLVNTILLLSSGFSLTWAHSALISTKRTHVLLGLGLTIILGLIFILCQLFEYKTANFSINDGIYGSIFYISTGFHGFHVLVGTIFLIVCWFRQLQYHFLDSQHLGFELSAWYWHFVDVVWIFLWFWVYVWGS